MKKNFIAKYCTVYPFFSFEKNFEILMPKNSKVVLSHKEKAVSSIGLEIFTVVHVTVHLCFILALNLKKLDFDFYGSL
jgi:hypothetical protein